ncbi:MAG: hypothetical protein ACP5C3_00735 [Methanomicrobiales archaeon]
MILNALEGLPHDMAILIIAHRQSTIKNADKIYLMDHGKIKESGPYEELLKSSRGRFKELFQTN